MAIHKNIIRSWIVFIYVSTIIVCFSSVLHSQVENVPADHRVYDFPHRMEARQILPSYHGAVIPISRGKIAGYLVQIYEQRVQLRGTDRELLDLYRLEFSYDLGYGVRHQTELLRRGPFWQRFIISYDAKLHMFPIIVIINNKWKQIVL